MKWCVVEVDTWCMKGSERVNKDVNVGQGHRFLIIVGHGCSCLWRTRSYEKKREEEVEVCGWYMQVDLMLVNLSLMCKDEFFFIEGLRMGITRKFRIRSLFLNALHPCLHILAV